MIPDGAFGVDWYIGNSYGTLRTSVVATTMRTTFTRMVTSSLSIGISRIPTGLFNSPGTYNLDVAGYVNKYGETYSSTSVNNSDYDSCGCINHQEKNPPFALRGPTTTASPTLVCSMWDQMVTSITRIGR